VRRHSRVLAEQVLVRPAGQTTSSHTFTNLSVGKVRLEASAHATNDGTGMALATGTAMAPVVKDQTTPVTLTLASTVTEVTVSPATQTLKVGQAQTFTATARDVVVGVVFAWTSSDPLVASVDPQTGRVTALAAGQATITATGDGVSSFAMVTVEESEVPAVGQSVTVTGRVFTRAARVAVFFERKSDGKEVNFFEDVGADQRFAIPVEFAPGDAGAYTVGVAPSGGTSFIYEVTVE